MLSKYEEALLKAESPEEFFDVVGNCINLISQNSMLSEHENVDFQQNVDRVKFEYEKKKQKNLQEKENEINRIDDEIENMLENVQLKKQEIEKKVTPTATNKYVYLTRSSQVRDEAEDILKRLKNIQSRKIDCINESRKQKRSNIEERVSQYNKELDDECLKEINRLKIKYQQLKDDRKKAADEEFLKLFKLESLRNAISNLGTKTADITKFVNHEELPEKICLGKIFLNSKILPQDTSYMIKTDFNSLFASIGTDMLLTRNRRDGFAIYADVELKKNMEGIQSFLIRQLCDFPAGRLELVMLDKSNTAIFSVLEAQLRKSDNRNIAISRNDTKEIITQIADVRKRLSNSINEYSNQFEEKIEAREHRENYRILALAGFPEGLTLESLKDLHMIVKEGGAYGVYTLIIPDRMALIRAKEDREKRSIIQEITETMDYISEDDGELFINTYYKNRKIKLSYKMDFSILKRDFISILNDVVKGIDEYIKAPLTLEKIESPAADQVNWQNSSSKDGFCIPIGRHGYDDVINLTIGRGGTADKLDIRHHVLIEGTTGAGKSGVLHTIVTSALLMYNPSELEIYYLDYKEGVEVNAYAEHNLPAFKVISLNGEREFGLKTLQHLVEILRIREEIFKDAQAGQKIALINDYRAVSPVNKMSRILLVIDEVGNFLSKKDDITAKSIECIKTLVMTGRAEGVHVILCAQTLTDLPEEVVNNMAVRIAFSQSKNLLESGNENLESVICAGNHGIFNDNAGSVMSDRPFRVAYIDSNEQMKLLSALSSIQNDDKYKGQTDMPSKIFYSCVDLNHSHPFNKLKMQDIKNIGNGKNVLTIHLGEAYDFYDKFDICLRRREFDNILIVGEDLYRACRLLYFVCLSIVHHNLQMGCSNTYIQNITMIDFGIDSVIGKKHFSLLENLFSNQIARYVIEEDSYEEDGVIDKAQDAINGIYDEFKMRELKNDFTEEEKYLIINGAEYLSQILDDRLYRGDLDDLFDGSTTVTKSLVEKIKDIVKYGARYGIHCVIQSGDYVALQDYFGSNYENYFNCRVAYDLEIELMKSLVKEKKESSLGKESATLYQYGKRSNRTFRIYDYPKEEWVREYARQYEILSESS